MLATRVLPASSTSGRQNTVKKGPQPVFVRKAFVPLCVPAFSPFVAHHNISLRFRAVGWTEKIPFFTTHVHCTQHFEPQRFDRVELGDQGRSKYGAIRVNMGQFIVLRYWPCPTYCRPAPQDLMTTYQRKTGSLGGVCCTGSAGYLPVECTAVTGWNSHVMTSCGHYFIWWALFPFLMCWAPAYTFWKLFLSQLLVF